MEHPFINHEVARLRTEERLSHGLAAEALRVREEQTSERLAVTSSRGWRLLDRVARRSAAAKRASRPAV